jgi:hypothetical protein
LQCFCPSVPAFAAQDLVAYGRNGVVVVARFGDDLKAKAVEQAFGVQVSDGKPTYRE